MGKKDYCPPDVIVLELRLELGVMSNIYGSNGEAGGGLGAGNEYDL